MTSIILENKQELLKEFKSIFKQLLLKNSLINFNDLMLLTLRTFDINAYSESESIDFKNWFENVYHLKFIHDILENDDFNEIIFHNEKSLQVKKLQCNTMMELDHLTNEDYQLAWENLVSKSNQIWNFSEPFVSFNYLHNDSEYRISMVHKSISVNNVSKVFIRKHHKEILNLSSFISNDTLTPTLIELVKSKQNILIVGSTGCGKTSLLNLLLEFSGQEEHTIIIEDTHEISLNRYNSTNLIADEYSKGKTLNDYCKYAMRMSPDRIILGEMRSNEVIPYLLAMNSGHKGLMSTIHANSAFDSISRLALLFSIYSTGVDLNTEFVTSLICKNLDYIIFIENKKIKEIAKVLGSDKESPFLETIYSEAA